MRLGRSGIELRGSGEQAIAQLIGTETAAREVRQQAVVGISGVRCGAGLA
jgi:hypothetical protein